RSVKDLDIDISNGEIVLKLYSDDDIGMEIWKLEDLSNNFKAVFGKQLRLEQKELTYVKNDNK
ncbi:MAG: hypothetical protein WCR83_07010, partial [Candidatus Methanomethylophilaceae archaeon]